MKKKTLNFGSKTKYLKYLAYGQIHGEFAKSPGNTPIKIKGKPHTVEHTRQTARQKAIKLASR